LIKDKRIVVGVCGGIAAYKAADLVSRLIKGGAQVKVIMTRAATEFVSPLTFQTLSNNRVVTDMFSVPEEWEIEHISLAQWADCFVIAPATANFLGKLAAGVADDMLTTTVMATNAAVVIASSMNTNMYNNRIVQRNIDYLKKMGYLFIDPAEGRLACGDTGIGRMEEPVNIVAYLDGITNSAKDLEGKTILVTAGPTREAIDPVRFLSNASSGKMGYSIARAADRRGARVILISGPTVLKPPPSVETVNVTTALEMYQQVMKYYPECDVVIKAAAVSDYRPAVQHQRKIKKTDSDMVIKLERNPDILQELGRNKGRHILVGFAAESNDIIEYAKEKLHHKNLDLIVANDITEAGAGFGGDTNAGFIIDRQGIIDKLPPMSKADMADRILDRVLNLLNTR
jgi:phosphopantothenoylcysteine decarboxylase/phosphopantothenate--cysteine ligase